MTRNRVKRLLREGIKPLEGNIDSGYMYVIIAYPSLAERNYAEVCKEVRLAFERAGKLK